MNTENITKTSKTIFEKLKPVASAEKAFLKDKYNRVTRNPVSNVIGKGGKLFGSGIGKFFGGAAKLGINAYRATPKSAKLGALAIGAVAMVGVGMIKGAMGASREMTYDRYMQDNAMNKNVLNSTRVPTGLSRMDKYNSTMGLTNALSRSRHGRF